LLLLDKSSAPSDSTAEKPSSAEIYRQPLPM